MFIEDIPLHNPGSCAAGGYAECCEDGVCSGEPADCFCDQFCRFLDDCCADIDETCPTEGKKTFVCGLLLIFHFSNHINPLSKVHLEVSIV